MDNNSCGTPKPFMILDPEGTTKAPILDYRLPQSNSFSTFNGVILLTARTVSELAMFTESAKKIPLYAQLLMDGTASLYSSGAIGGEFLLQNRPAPVNTDPNQPVYLIDQDIPLEYPAFGLEGTGNNQIRNLPALLVKQPSTSTQDASIASSTETWKAPEGLNLDEFNKKIKEGFALRIFSKFGGFENGYEYIKRPIKKETDGRIKLVALPTISIIEEYSTQSFLGNYGAGSTKSTQSLFPLEKVKMTLKTFKEISTVKSRAENIIDSMSKESANEMETLLENESKQSQSSSTDNTRSGNISFKIPFKLGGSIGGGANASRTTKSSRESSMRNLSKSMQKHVDKSNSSREIKINTSTEEKQTEREEVGIEREFTNPNVSRVLNFVFRELLQEYVSITYLKDIKVCFSNGHPEYDKIIPIEELDDFLSTYLVPTQVNTIKEQIFAEYSAVRSIGQKITPTNQSENYLLPFLERIDIVTQRPTTNQNTNHYFTKKRDLIDTYEDFLVEGVILNVDKFTLRTPAVIVDALLGQGEALDCYGQKLQDESVRKAKAENAKLEKELSKMDAEITKIANEVSKSNAEAAKIQAEANRIELVNQIIKELKDSGMRIDDLVVKL